MRQDEQKRSREEELDAFWDIDALLPKKKTFFNTPSDTSAAEIEFEPKQAVSAPQTQTQSTAVRRFIPPHSPTEEKQTPKPQAEYDPDHALIRHVRIYHPKSNYQYYEAFLRDAIRLYPIHGEKCDRVTFFSYVPQYSQMSRAQLEWYLWWRECVRNGEYLQTDYSYVLLYLYELINLSEKLEPQKVQADLFAIWEHYREIYHQLDGYLSEWICDFSLLHRLTLPTDCSPRLLSAAMTHCTLKEFYFASDSSSGYAGALIAFCNNYDYKKSKFYTTENAKLFDQNILAILNMIIDTFSAEGKLFSETKMDDSKVIRNAYTGALCACSIKRNLEVEYCSFSRSNELRYLITDVIKYTENLLRAHLGIRSRLTVYSLPNGVRERIDAYLQTHLPPRASVHKAKKAEIEETYEKLYDIPNAPLSLAHAAEIERLSWNTTERLIDAFSDGETENMPFNEPAFEAPAPVLTEAKQDETDGVENVSEHQLCPYIPFLKAVQNGDGEAQRSYANDIGKMPDAIVDEINEIAVDRFGDILLEDTGDGFAVIEDYTDLLDELIQNA